ncbi:phytanoyl-CoA dioxygenase family protein [Oscillochloris sp. ZM17-4]|uniref:phytanoyl-CoA dioxygenase family protein n=1 Tax=Oscillochloris sp. ZM17-4 TaxID=2866714 RepID=UPI001C73AE73|nr:phytanoyl-CoA dioxygenase family protein [Oscillochloris sp. ZM17-4]MBX0330309.1 phytanoyl-CoA dioxygenase family protein [Oscillochloris sp. ZM17-4]
MTTTVEMPPIYLAEDERTPHHLTDEQIRFYDEHGYLILRSWIPADMLARLQAAGQAWIADGERVSPEQAGDDYNFAQRPAGPALFRVNYLHNKGQAASLELLGSPQVLAVAESLCGPNFVPTYESMVFKQAGDGERIPWHQDAVQPTQRYRIFNFDLYLDPSLPGAGALRVLPGTHRQRQDICALTDAYGWEHPDTVEVEMHPGDVLLHNVMVVHGSPRVEGKGLRRTIYYEFRAAEEIIADGPWDRAWIARRMRLLPLGLAAYGRAYPQAEPFSWRADAELRPAALGSEEAELKVAHEVHMSGSYCSAGDAGRE